MGISHQGARLLEDPASVIDWLENTLDDDTWQNPYSFLSNFFTGAPFTVDGVEYKTVEHWYQSFKTLDESWRARIIAAATPDDAKALGQICPKRPGREWDAIKFDVMTEGVRHKFAQPWLVEKLISTGDALIQEGSFWHDAVWGVDLLAAPTAAPTKRPGKNYVGVILMAERARLQAESRCPTSH